MCEETRKTSVLIWLAIVAGASVLLALETLAPLLAAHGQFWWAASLYRVFGLICHQRPERSFYLAGYPLAVCARCVGLYAGFAAGALCYPLFVHPLGRAVPPPRLWFLLALVPTALDFGLDFCGVHSNTHFSRAATGLLLGAVSAFYVIPGLVDMPRAAKSFFAAAIDDKLPTN